MHTTKIIGCCILILLAGCTGTLVDSGAKSGSQSAENSELNETKIERHVHQEVNNFRTDGDKEALEYDSELGKIADYYAHKMDNQSFFSHASPEGETREERYNKFDYRCRIELGKERYLTGGENLFSLSFENRQFTEKEIANQTVDAWINSPAHRDTMLKYAWGKEGIGVSVSSDSEGTEVYVVQNFC